MLGLMWISGLPWIDLIGETWWGRFLLDAVRWPVTCLGECSYVLSFRCLWFRYLEPWVLALIAGSWVAAFSELLWPAAWYGKKPLCFMPLRLLDPAEVCILAVSSMLTSLLANQYYWFWSGSEESIKSAISRLELPSPPTTALWACLAESLLFASRAYLTILGLYFCLPLSLSTHLRLGYL